MTANSLNRMWRQLYGVESVQEFYTKVNFSQKLKDRLGIDKLPFPLSAMEKDEYAIRCHPLVNSILFRYSDLDYDNSFGKKMLQTLKTNPPNESFENPKLPSNMTYEEKSLSSHVFCFGIDLPGSMSNPYGNLEYWGNFFIDMYFGNYTVVMEHINSLSSVDLGRELERRLGYCQFSPIFAPILGLKMINLDNNPYFTKQEKDKFRTLYSGNNENRHLDILEKLLELGADVNAHDIHGYTPLQHALNPVLCCDRESVVRLLLKYGAHPDPYPNLGFMPVTLFFDPETDEDWRIVDMIIEQYKIATVGLMDGHFSDQVMGILPRARLAQMHLILMKNITGEMCRDGYYIKLRQIRIMFEMKYSKKLAVKWREAFPKNQNECENSNCFKRAEKKCGACGKVVYCTPACQKLDWTFHKITCRKTRQNK